MGLDHRSCYAAVASRDRRYDGKFFTGVTTTGIYCRPVCPARTPKSGNVRFFACAAAAEQAGFRPCRRCRPDAAPGTPVWHGTSATVTRALRLIDAGELDRGGVDDLADRLGMSDRQLRRLFTEHLGVGPLRVARTRRVHFARRLLDETDLPMTQVALSAGFRSVRQFNHAVQVTFGRAPRELRAAARCVETEPERAAPRDEPPSRSRIRAHRSAELLTLRLPFRPPFHWEALIGFLGPRAIPGVEVANETGYWRTITVVDGESGRDERGVIGVTAARDAYHLDLHVGLGLTCCLMRTVERVRAIFDLNADPQRIATHLQGDALIAGPVRRHPGLRLPGSWDPFELAVRAVLGQQITVRGATTLSGRLVRKFGSRMPDGAAVHAGLPEDLRRQLTCVFPPPERLASVRLATLMGIGLTRARAETLRGLARAAHADPGILAGADGLEAAIERLTALPGIGEWTAHYIAMRAMREPDAFPAGDLGLRRMIADLQGQPRPVSQRVLRGMAEAWSPWRAYAAMVLWTELSAGGAKRNTRRRHTSRQGRES